MDAVEGRYQQLFETTPVSLWEEDWRAVFDDIERLRNEGVTDFETYFAQHPEVVSGLASKVQITDINTYSWTMFEADSKQQMLTSLDQVFDEASFPVFLKQMVSVANGETFFESEAYARTFKGRRLHVAMAARVFERQGDSVPVVLSMMDITQRKEMELELRQLNEELQRSNEELEQFAYVASHDLQEPLRMVASYTQLLEQRYGEHLDDRARKYIDYAVDGAKRMQGLISDLLELSRIGTQGKSLVPTSADEILDKVLANLRLSIEECGGRVTREPLPTVAADRGQLAQLLQNLIANGLKFHRPEAPPVIHVSAARADDAWTFSVRDNGIGIAEEFAGDVFNVFRRLNKRGEYEGNGIGLAVAKKIVARHKGRLWLESVPGEGSTFYFTLPTLD